MIKVFILNEKKYDGVTWYRYVQMANKAKELGLAQVEFINPHVTEEQLAQILANTDIYLARANPSMLAIRGILDKFNVSKPLVIDMDDGFDNVDPFADIYRNLGTKDVQLEDKTYLWQDGVNGFDIKANKERVKTFKDVISGADMVTVTTFELKNYVAKFNPKVAVIPNSIDLEKFPQVKVDRKDIRLVYAGGSTHYADLMMIKPALDELMRNNPNLHFHFLGVPFKGVTKDMPQDRVHSYGWVNADAHGYRLACIDGDIGICPLQDTKFNRLKSSVKYYEYSAVGMATVATDIPPYSDDIINKSTGLLTTSTDFYTSVQSLIDDPVLRTKLAGDAYEYVKRNRSLEDITRDWVALLEGVINAKKN